MIYIINNLRNRCERLIVALKIIGKVVENDKLVFRNKDVIIQRNNYLTSIQRYLWSNNRTDTVNGISNLLDDVENMITECDGDSVLLNRLGSSLLGIFENTHNGLGALCITYSDDAVCVANFECLIDRANIIHRQIVN